MCRICMRRHNERGPHAAGQAYRSTLIAANPKQDWQQEHRRRGTGESAILEADARQQTPHRRHEFISAVQGRMRELPEILFGPARSLNQEGNEQLCAAARQEAAANLTRRWSTKSSTERMIPAQNIPVAPKKSNGGSQAQQEHESVLAP